MSNAEEEEEVDYENDVVYEPELEGLLDDLRYILDRTQINNPAEDEEEDEMGGWVFDNAPPAPGIIRAPHHHHHHHHTGPPRGFGEMFGMLGGNDTFRRKRLHHSIYCAKLLTLNSSTNLSVSPYCIHWQRRR